MKRSEAPENLQDIKVGDSITYRTPSLWGYKGEVIKIERTPNGGDCLIRWRGNMFDSEEMISNLRRV